MVLFFLCSHPRLRLALKNDIILMFKVDIIPANSIMSNDAKRNDINSIWSPLDEYLDIWSTNHTIAERSQNEMQIVRNSAM